MNRELNQDLKNFNFLNNLKIGYLVDAVDEQRWKLAKIVNTKSYGHRHIITLHFDGYPDKWDEDFELPASTKLAPIRRFTPPYTGPEGLSRLEINRPSPNMDFTGPLKDLNRLITKKELKQAEFINQTYRGEMFILVDNILTKKIQLSQQTYKSCVQFLKVYLSAGLAVLNFALQKISQISKDNITDPNIIYVSPTHALINSIPEFLYNINSLINAKEKRIKFHSYNEAHCKSSDSLKMFKEYFISKKGVQLCKALLEYQSPPNKSFSWNIKKDVFILMANMIDDFPFPKVQDSRQITELLDHMHYIMNKQAISQDTFEKKHIELVINLIKDGNFEGKIRGLNQLKKLTDKVASKSTVLVEQIQSSKILYLMTESSTFNRELFRRSISLFQFAEKKQLLTQEIVQRIINLHKDKQELQLKAFYETLVSFAKFLQTEKCVEFYHKIQKFTFSEHLVTFIKQYTLKAINQHLYFRKKYMQKGAEFGLLYFWKIIEESEKYDRKLVNQVEEAFSMIITDIYYREQMEKYVKLAIAGIKQKRNVESFMKVIKFCLKSNRKVAGLIENLDDEANIVDSIVKSLVNSKEISTKGIQSAFQFLEQVNHCVKKKITVDHIKILWKIPQCRKYLLKFMRKYRPSRIHDKSTQKILSKQLSQPQIKEILEKIFLSDEMMDAYKNINDETFQTADELIIAYNNAKKFIQYNYKHTIRNSRPNEMYGLNFYLKIIINCQDVSMATRAAKRFIQFYMRVQQRRFYQLNNQKIESWMICIDKLMKISKRMYFALSIFFEEIKGRMKSINILEPSTITLVVLLKGKNLTKTLSLPRYTSLWKLRLLLNEQFQLENTNFEMFFPVKSTETDMEKQEDFSLALIDIPKDPTAPAVVLTPSRQTHPHFEAIQHFKVQFSAAYGQKLYQSLESASDEEQNNILNILFLVPPFKQIEKKIQKFDASEWEEILSSHNKAKLSYQLYVINKLKSPEFAINFNKRKGIEQIMKILLSRTKSGSQFKKQDYSIFKRLLQLFTEMLKFYKTTKSPLPFKENALIQILKPPQQINENVLEYFYQMFIVLKEIANYPEICIRLIIEDPIMTAVLQIVFFGNSNSEQAAAFSNNLIGICEKGKFTNSLTSNMEGFLNIDFLIKKMYNCRQFFSTLTNILNKSLFSDGLLQKMLEFISRARKCDFRDQNSETTNQLLFGWLKILKLITFWEMQNVKVNMNENMEKYAEFLIRQGLFSNKCRLKTAENRRQAYEVLNSIKCREYVYNLINQTLRNKLVKSTWRRQYEWYVRSFIKRDPSEQVGLKNLAATCYINSLLQQLFFIKKFREPLFAINGKQIEDPENIVYEIQKIFAHLEYSQNRTYTTESLCRTFILDGQPIDPRIQTDVDEFFHSLMDKLERNLMKKNKQEIIDNVFRGQYSNLIVGQQCPHKSQRFEHFISMRLQIINKKSLNQALEQFIKGQYLEGQNAYYCEKCDKKVKALKRVCVKSLPEILILTLKRFEFDFDKMEKFKLNTYCEFPEQLDMFPYMRQALYKDEDKMKAEQYKYRLKGTIIHYGLSQAGHYTSYIKMSDGKWKYFDDDRISDFDIKDLEQQCFGGVEERIYSENSQKIKNSYLLIYEKVQSKQEKPIKAHQSIISQVQDQNQRNNDIKMLFEEGLINFIMESYENMPQGFLIYLHLVILRSQFRGKKMITAYQKAIDIFKDKNICNWYLNQFSENIIKEFLIYGHFQVSHFVASLVIQCVKKVHNPDFIRRCLKCLDRKNMVPLNRVFQEAIADESYRKALGAYSFGDKVYRIIKQDKSPSTANTQKIADVKSQFGEAAEKFSEKRDFRSQTELFCAIQKFKIDISLQQIDQFSIRIKKIPPQVSFAKIIAQKIKDPENLEQFNKTHIAPKLIKSEPKIDEEHSFLFYLILIHEICMIKDENSLQRNKLLAQTYYLAMKESLTGYKAERYLVQGLFNIAFSNQAFLDAMSEILVMQKKMVKNLKQWIRESQKAYFHVKDRKLGYWREISPKYYYTPQNQLMAIEKDLKIPSQKYLNLLNALIERHPTTYPNTWTTKPEISDIVLLNDGYGNVFEVIEKAGILLQVRNSEDDSTRFLPEGDVIILSKK